MCAQQVGIPFFYVLRQFTSDHFLFHVSVHDKIVDHISVSTFASAARQYKGFFDFMRRVELRYRPQLKLPPIPGLPVPYSTIAKYRTNIVRHASLDLGFHSTHTMPPINGLIT